MYEQNIETVSNSSASESSEFYSTYLGSYNLVRLCLHCRRGCFHSTHADFDCLFDQIVKEMCREAPSQIIKSQPLEVISSVMKHTQGTEAKKKAVLSTLTHEWMKKVAKHFCAVLDAAGKEGVSGVHGMKQMFIQAGLIDADDNNAAPANNTRRRSEKEDDTIVVSSSPAPKTIDPLPFEVAQYDDQSRNDYTLLLKPEPSQTGRSDPPTPIEGDIEQSITKKIAESQFSEQTWSLEEFAHNHWLVHFEEEEHAKGLVNRSIKVDGGYKLSFEQFGKKLSQVFVCSTVPKNVSHDRILSTIVESTPACDLHGEGLQYHGHDVGQAGQYQMGGHVFGSEGKERKAVSL